MNAIRFAQNEIPLPPKDLNDLKELQKWIEQLKENLRKNGQDVDDDPLKLKNKIKQREKPPQNKPLEWNPESHIVWAKA